ncbi:MAG: DUF2924 domain-containing protein [Elusimicrobiaceae bacterium]|jgi:hypothetical protein|nr:DUF2924 domain-containing protein [Elusimicrobiaceae bacterium]MBT5987328.1 DUF2924 domain-containing protein [Elusimicrobiaceae bacterium]MBT7282857.1 DUF2924 domain-containing protein [Elusimicrobiaceae bacterium]
MKEKIYLPKTFDEFKKLNFAQISVLWIRYFDSPPKNSIKAMIRSVWYKVQCDNMNLKIAKKNIARLNRYSQNPNKYIEKANKQKYHLREGTEIIKNYKGVEYKVKVLADNELFYDGQTYQTLSAVAKAICGSKVSGPDFFGFN